MGEGLVYNFPNLATLAHPPAMRSLQPQICLFTRTGLEWTSPLSQHSGSGENGDQLECGICSNRNDVNYALAMICRRILAMVPGNGSNGSTTVFATALEVEENHKKLRAHLVCPCPSVLSKLLLPGTPCL